MNILSKLWPVPNVEQVPGLGYNFEVQVPVTNSLLHQPVLRADYQMSSTLRFTAKYAGQLQGQDVDPGSLPGLQRPAALEPESACAVGDRQLQPVAVDVPRGHLRLQLQRDRQSVREPAVEPRERRAGGSADAVPAGRPGRSRPTTPRACSAPPNSPFYTDGRVMYPPNFSWGNRIANAPPNLGRAAGQHQSVARRVVQPDEAGGPAHAEGRRLLEPRLQGAAARHRRRDAVPGRAQLRQRHAEPARQRLRLRQCRARHPELVCPAVGRGRRRLHLQQPRLVRCRTTGR